MWCNNSSSIHYCVFTMTDEKNILYKKDYVTSAKTDIRKTFAKFRKEQKAATKISTSEKTQPINIVQYKKFR